MPIKYQALGGGEFQTLMITTNPNVQVKLSNDKYSKTITTNEHGQAEFKNLKAGVYSLIVALSDGNSFTKQIVVNGVIDDNLGEIKQLKDVDKKQKLKLSNGRIYSIIGKNLSWHTPKTNSVTLMDDFVYGDTFIWLEHNTSDKDTYEELHENIFQTLVNYEKKRVIEQTYNHKYGTSTFHFITPCQDDVNNSQTLTSDNDRIRRNPKGEPKGYWLRSTSGYSQWFVNDEGVLGRTEYPSGFSSILSTFDIQDDTWVSKGVDGYWRILDY